MSSPAPRLGDLSAVKLALIAKRVRSESQAVLRADPIAIIGMGCRAPGGADSPERYWDLLRSGRDGIREVPADRWGADAWYDADPAAPAKMSTKWGGFLEHIDGFDAGYFGILPREAERMDPQQRLFLEVAIEAIDDAGLPRDGLRGSRAGVYIASYQNDYSQLQYDDLEAVDARTLTGTLHSVLANRLSYVLDLRGPSISIDTACSSSLVAIHLACQSLRTGETELAIAGGVSLMITPALMVSLCKVGFMAPDGRCKTFDAHADGFGRGEGCGVIVLKRLADAISDDDRILGVIRGSAVNQDGHSTVLAAPNGLAHRALITEALGNAQLDPARIGFVEAHGTGTALGDPIEVEAIAATVGRQTPGAGPCFLGAAKANLGHLEAAAGVMGVIKTVLALEHEAIPPQPNFRALSPHIALAGTRLAVPTALTPWPRGDVPRCGAVSAFGVGGTNAHVILEEVPQLPPADASPTPGEARVLPLSAQSPAALRALAESWVRFLDATPAAVDDLCRTAAERRSHYDERLAVVAGTKEGLRARLAERLADAHATLGRRSAAPPRVAFVFSGQGPQWYAMGRELLATEPVFRDVVAACDALLRPLSGWSLLDALAATEEASRLDETEVAQPALFALQVALAALWKSWGIVADGVVGHSVGEIAALHVAGVLTLAEAVRIVWHRGQIMQQATGLGRMAQVRLSASDAADAVRPFGDKLSVAAVNAPRSAVLSGDAAALESALASLSARGVSHRMLPVQYAFHSAQMAPFQRRLAETLGPVSSAAPSVPVYSTVTGGLATDARFDGAYFGRNVREAVRFASAVGAMAADGYDAFVEIGPHPVLAASITETLDEAHASGQVVASLRRGRPERETLLQACTKLYESGASLAWATFQPYGAVTALPAYPWQRKRHWIRANPDAPRGAASGHPLLGWRVPVAGTTAQIFEGGSGGAQAWSADHRIFDRLILPAAAVLDTFAAAARASLGDAPALTDFTMERPLFVPEPNAPAVRWQTTVTPRDAGGAELALYEAVDEGEARPETWRRIATASAGTARETASRAATGAPLTDEAIDVDAVYARFAALGVAFGPSFRGLREVRRGEGVAEGWLDLPAGLESEASLHVLHPVTLDAGLQLCSLAANRGPAGELPADVLLPLGADRIRIVASPGGSGSARIFARARVRDAGPGGSLAADVVFEARDGERVSVVAEIDGLRFARADRAAFAPRTTTSDVYDVVWHRVAPSPPATTRGAPGIWLIFADRGGLGAELARELTASGDRACLVAPGDTFAKAAPDAWVVDPANAAQFGRLLSEAVPAGVALRGVVHLWSLDAAPLAACDAASADFDGALVVASTLHLVQALASAATGATGPLWLVSRGAQVVTGDERADTLRPRAASLWGFGGVVAVEHPELDVRRLDLDPRDANGQRSKLLLAELRATFAPGDGLRTAALRSEQWWSPRIERHRVQPSRAATADEGPRRVEVAQAGTLDGAVLKSHPRPPLAPGEVRLRVLAAGINFRDVLMTLGMYPGEAVPLGVECAGVVIEIGANVRDFAPGARVFGYAPGSLATEVTVPAAFLAPIPPGLGDEDAAALPVAFLTAYYGLHRLADLRRGQRVLIHAAAGGVGLAATQLALRTGAEVFATAGSDDKRGVLRALGVAHVMDSRSLAFADAIRARTAGEGVDVVLNSLAGDFIEASLGVLKKGGTFLELGKRDVMTAAVAARLRPDATYHLYDLGSEAQADHALLRPMLDAIIAALAAGELRPLPVKVYALDDVGEALRFMAQARHVGKLVVRPEATADTSSASMTSSEPLVVGDATYWVTGGLGGLGLETARWLARSGAKHLVLTGRRAPSAQTETALRDLEKGGVTVRVALADTADGASMQAVLDGIRATLPPLRGVIHAAGIVDDAPLVRLTWERCRGVLAGKAHGAEILHELTRELPLAFFVLYSAAGQLLGAPGQAAYAAANAELDALANARRRLGLPALSVAWGAWADVGMAADLASRGPDVWAARGLGTISPASGFAELERLLRDGAAYAAVLPIEWPTFLTKLPVGADRRFFEAVGASPIKVPALPAAPAFPAVLRALPSGQRRSALVAHLRERAAQVIGLDATARLDARVPLKELGLDSLMAVELRNSVARSMGQALPATLLFDYPTLDALAAHLARVLALDPDVEAESKGLRSSTPSATSAASAASAAAAKEAIAELSDQEAEALLLKELEGDSTWRTHGG